MPIKMSKYVDIKSGISNIRTATEKELIARIFTIHLDNAEEVLEYDNSNDVREQFGSESAEYKIAQKYFAFINKYSRSPRKISFYWDWRDGSQSSIMGDFANFDNLQLITAGAIKITFGDISEDITDIDLSSATILGEVAGILQAAIRGANESELFTNANVFATQDGKIVIIAGETGNANINVEQLNDSPLYEDLGFDNSSMYIGHTKGTINEVFDKSYQVNNNFATFVFINDMSDTGQAVRANVNDVEELGTHINEQYPSEFMFIVPVLNENVEDITNAVNNISGISLELCSDTEEAPFNFVLPMAITATTDYNKENGTVNYMYTRDNNISVVVDDDNDAERYDGLKVNYYGRTQQAGQKLAFYQNGVLQGNYQDQNIYVNEIWLKDALTTKFLNYMLLTSNWYANKAGQSIGQGLIVDIIERAKLNGTITTEKEISENDKNYIYNITTDENAWRQIYQLGYYLITSIEKVKINNQDTYQFNYTLIYSKGDSIKKVEGQNILI